MAAKEQERHKENTDAERCRPGAHGRKIARMNEEGIVDSIEMKCAFDR